MAEKKRISVKYKTPNPLFEKWLTEWYNQAKEHDSKMQYTFNAALKSLRKYPLPFESGKDCLILKGFGNKLCEMLDKKLKDYKQNKITEPENITAKSPKRQTPKKVAKVANPRKNGVYKPAKDTGPYAILIALAKKNQENSDSGGFFTKAEIIEHARYFCDKSFTKPDPGSFYTAWTSISTLVTKGLVIKKGSPVKYQLSESGEQLANELLQEIEPTSTSSQNIEDLVCPEYKDSQESQTSSINNTETIIFKPGSFDIILLVDIHETGAKDPSEDETIFELNKHQIKYEIRHLKVGDFTWICREKTTKKELILPYIAERKRMDDLGHSIKDGRFHEQKFRLKQCGVQNLIYIVESYGNNTRTCLPLSSLLQGATNTLIQDQFQVKFTESQKHSIQYLSGVTMMLTHVYEQKTLMATTKENLENTNVMDDLIPLMVFHDFNKGASKNKKFKVKEVFIRQLLQLKGVSVDKALVIADEYPTPKLLKMKYDMIDASEGEKLLANIKFGPLKKSIGPVISKTIYQLYTSHTLK